MPLVSMSSVSPAMAPPTVALRLAPGAAVLPSYSLLPVPPMVTDVLRLLGVMLPATDAMVGAAKL